MTLQLLKDSGIPTFEWPGNAPDLNATEPAWGFMKRRTTFSGQAKTKQAFKKVWLQAWKELSQDKIRQWIEAIPEHIQEIIRLEGGNEYREGAAKFHRRTWKGTRLKGVVLTLQMIDKKGQWAVDKRSSSVENDAEWKDEEEDNDDGDGDGNGNEEL